MIRSVDAIPPVAPRPQPGAGADGDRGFQRLFTAALESQADLARIAERFQTKDGLLGLQVEVFRATQQLELGARLVQSSVETARKLLETPV